MIAFAGMLVPAAEKAGIKVPENLEDYDRNEYKHWWVFQQVQLGTAMPNPDSHWRNAEVISKLTEEEITTVSVEGLINRGYEVLYNR